MEKQALLVALLVTVALTTKLSISLDSYEKQCFFEILRKGGSRQNRSRSTRST
jgi:hypothetical protein